MKNKKGFTLIELILVILLIGIIAGFVGGMLLQETNMFSLIIPRKEAKLEGKLVLERILKDLRYAYSNNYTTGSNIRFVIPPEAYKQYTAVYLYTSGQTLYLKTNNTAQNVIADNVTYFNITSIRANYSNYTSKVNTRNLVNVTLTIRKEGKDITQKTTVYLRNKR